MEEKKKTNWKNVIWASVNVLAALAAYAVAFGLSVWAGFAAIVFTGLGFAFGYFKRSHKETQRFYNTLLEHKEDFFNGKTVVVTMDDENGEFTAVIEETKPEKNKKKKAVQED